MERHRYSRVFGDMSPEEYAALRADVAENGFIDDVVVIYEGCVLDGWHRFRVSQELGIPVKAEEYCGESALAYVASKNFHRRHLTAQQRAALIVRHSAWLMQGANQYRVSPVSGEVEPISTHAMANAAGVSQRTITKTKEALRVGVDASAREAIADALIAGETTAERVVKEAKREAVVARQAEREARVPSETVQLYACEVAALSAHVPAGSVDVILTDPPYGREFLPCWGDLARFAVHALKPGGHLLALSGHPWLPEVFAEMSVDGLDYHFLRILQVSGTQGSVIDRWITRVACKPLLWYVKGRENPVHVMDTVRGTGQDKAYHRWGQAVGEFYQMLVDYAAPGDTVCDPFLGGGTTALAAVERGCTFIGADIDDACIATTRERLGIETE